MVRQSKFSHVFLSCSRQNSGLAHLVIDVFRQHELEVFSCLDIEPDSDIFKMSDALRQELGACSAVVVILTRESVRSAWVLSEFGMAWALQKPVVVLVDGVEAEDVPEMMRKCEQFSLDRVHELAERIRQMDEPFDEGEISELTTVYRDFGMSADKLLIHPEDAIDLTRELNGRLGTSFGRQRVVQELIRLRMQGRLPRIPKRKTSHSP